MRNPWTAAALLAAALIAFWGGARTEARAPDGRRTAVVEAVRKTRASIVKIGRAHV